MMMIMMIYGLLGTRVCPCIHVYKSIDSFSRAERKY